MKISVQSNVTEKQLEAAIIKTTLEIKGGNRTHTAKALGIGITTLQRRLKEMGLSDYLTRNPKPKAETAA